MYKHSQTSLDFLINFTAVIDLRSLFFSIILAETLNTSCASRRVFMTSFSHLCLCFWCVWYWFVPKTLLFSAALLFSKLCCSPLSSATLFQYHIVLKTLLFSVLKYLIVLKTVLYTRIFQDYDLWYHIVLKNRFPVTMIVSRIFSLVPNISYEFVFFTILFSTICFLVSYCFKILFSGTILCSRYVLCYCIVLQSSRVVLFLRIQSLEYFAIEPVLSQHIGLKNLFSGFILFSRTSSLVSYCSQESVLWWCHIVLKNLFSSDILFSRICSLVVIILF